MAVASTVADGMVTGTRMAGAIAPSADMAGIMRVSEAADLRMKALVAAGSTVVANFVGVMDSTEVVEGLMVAADFMEAAKEGAGN